MLANPNLSKIRKMVNINTTHMSREHSDVHRSGIDEIDEECCILEQEHNRQLFYSPLLSSTLHYSATSNKVRASHDE